MLFTGNELVLIGIDDNSFIDQLKITPHFYHMNVTGLGMLQTIWWVMPKVQCLHDQPASWKKIIFVFFQALNWSVHRFHPGFQAHNDDSRKQREQQKEPSRVKPDSWRNFSASLPNRFICLKNLLQSREMYRIYHFGVRQVYNNLLEKHAKV